MTSTVWERIPDYLSTLRGLKTAGIRPAPNVILTFGYFAPVAETARVRLVAEVAKLADALA